MDDISDSFDYNHKYAVLEYIKEILEYRNKSGEKKLFNLVLLTHNYDFYRNAFRVLDIDIKNTLIARKTYNRVEVKPIEGKAFVTNIFSPNKEKLIACKGTKKSTKRKELRKIIISSIPMVRTLIEFQTPKYNQEKGYKILTSLLHYNKKEKIKLKEVVNIFNEYWMKNAEIEIDDEEKLVYEELIDQADGIVLNEKKLIDEINDKFILSMAIRLKAEKYMIEKTDAKGGKQTRELLNDYKQKYPEDKYLGLFEKVCMFANEYIHLNSFMYEPLIDMSAMDLYNLYNEIKKI